MVKTKWRSDLKSTRQAKTRTHVPSEVPKAGSSVGSGVGRVGSWDPPIGLPEGFSESKEGLPPVALAIFLISPAPTWAQACYFHSFLVQCPYSGMSSCSPKSSHIIGRQADPAPTSSL